MIVGLGSIGVDMKLDHASFKAAVTSTAASATMPNQSLSSTLLFDNADENGAKEGEEGSEGGESSDDDSGEVGSNCSSFAATGCMMVEL
jgi:hypothetical protein